MAKRKRRWRLLRWLRPPLTFWRVLFALLRQFRQSVIAFVVVTIVGGMLYGELHELSGRPPIAPQDRPYLMLQLMILETPAGYDSAPEEGYLLLFWYALPPILLFIIGTGAADFVRLFFSDAWRKIVISNYEDHVIVMGAGHVGLRVVRWLHEWGVKVVVIDNELDEEADEELEHLAIRTVIGDGRNKQTMLDANIHAASAFIACTGDDSVNLYAIMRARAMNDDLHIVVRVWDDSFNEQIEQFIINSNREDDENGLMTSVLSSSNLSAPIFAGLALGIELTQTIEIAGEEYATVRLTVNEGSFLIGQTVGSVQEKHDVDIVLYCAGGREPDIQPARHTPIRAGDILVLFALQKVCINIAKRNHFRQ